MKKLLLCFIASGMLFSNAIDAQHAEGQKHFDVYYGIPGHKGALFRVIDIVDGGTVDVSVLGNVGLRFQYFMTPKFAIGFDGNFTQRKATTTIPYVNASGATAFYTETVQQTLIRAMFRTSWEFLESNGFQMNWANSIGYRNSTWSVASDDPNYESTWDVSIGFPLAFRTALGMGYMFSDKIGINIEAGFGGGALLNAGLTIAL